MCTNVHNHKCTCFIYFLYFIFIIGSSVLVILLFKYPLKETYDYNDGLIEINGTYHFLSDYPDLNELINEYSSLIKNHKDISFDFVLHYYIIPAFTLITIIFSIRFVCYDRDKIIFIISGFLLCFIKFLALLDSYVFNLKLSSLPKIDKQKGYKETDIKEFSYEDMKINEYMLLICLLAISIELITFFLLYFLNKEKKIKKNENYNFHSITIIIIFGVMIIFLIDFYVVYSENCKSEYHIHFTYSDYYYIDFYRYYTLVNNTKIYFSKNRRGVSEFGKEYCKYYFKDYPILKELDKIYYSYSESYFHDSQFIHIIDLFYFFVHVLVAPFFLFLTFIFFPIYKCCDKCKIAYFISYITFLVLIFITIFYSGIKFGTKEYLENDKKEIQYIIDDFNQFEKCVIKFPLAKIFEAIFFIILLFPIIVEIEFFKCCKLFQIIAEIEFFKCCKYCKYCNQEEDNENKEDEEKGGLLPKNENENKIEITFEIEQIPYYLEVNKNSKFKDVIIDFKNKYNDFKNKNINNALFGGKDLLSDDNKSKTIEQLKVKSRDIILIYLN